MYPDKPPDADSLATYQSPRTANRIPKSWTRNATIKPLSNGSGGNFAHPTASATHDAIVSQRTSEPTINPASARVAETPLPENIPRPNNHVPRATARPPTAAAIASFGLRSNHPDAVNSAASACRPLKRRAIDQPCAYGLRTESTGIAENIGCRHARQAPCQSREILAGATRRGNAKFHSNPEIRGRARPRSDRSSPSCWRVAPRCRCGPG